MANSKQATKRAKTNLERRMRNRIKNSIMKTQLNKLNAAISNKDSQLAVSEYRKTTSILDSYAARGILHKNKAARLKKSYNSKVKAIKTNAS